MRSLTIHAHTPYNIYIGNHILNDLGKAVAKEFSPCTAAIITDDIVANLYLDKVKNSLERQGFQVITFSFPNGEHSKNLTIYGEILEFLAGKQLTRGDLIVALGGGVVGDMAGFVAASYLRGIPYIQVPTTFLSAIDSSVGGKTAVNLKAGKNLAGAFYQPSLVWCDYETLKTQTYDRFADGIAEAVKYGVLGDKELFRMLREEDLWEQMEPIILRCLTMKERLVREDEFDRGARQLLNLGHTLGHAIEKESDFTITHGHAVAIGMVLIAKVAKAQGISEMDCAAPIIEVFQKHHLPIESPYPIDTYLDTIKNDKKRNGDSIQFVVPKTIGHCVLHAVDVNKMEAFLQPIGES